MRIEGAGIVKNARHEEHVVKTTVKVEVARIASPHEHNAVKAARHELNNAASMIRAQLTTAFAAAAKPAVATPAAQPAATLTPAQASAKADEIVARHGGRNRLDTDAVGREIADIAKSNPADARAVQLALLGDSVDQGDKGKVKERDKDEVAQSFARSLSDADLATIGQSADGKALLDKFRSHLLAGNVHDDERADAARLEKGAKGYTLPNLTGDPARDAKTVADDLAKLPADKRDDYLLELARFPYGLQVLQRAGTLDENQRNALASAFNEAYRSNPSETAKILDRITDMDKLFPVAEFTGLADVIRRTGNDGLIAGFARHAMDVAAKGGVDKGAWNVDALTALGGMSPQGLENFINFGTAQGPRGSVPPSAGAFIAANREKFNAMLNSAGDFLGMAANNAGFPNPWAFNPAMGDFLNVVNRMTDSKGNLSGTALDIFKTIAPKTGDNIFTKQAVGAMFVEHARQIVDTFGSKRNPDGTYNDSYDPKTLEAFFLNVVYSPISDILEYKGGSLTAAIMGDGTKEGALGTVAQSLMDEAAKPGANKDWIGQELGTLFGTATTGFLDSVAAYKSKFADDKKFREFVYGIFNKGLGAVAKRYGVPADKVAGFVEKAIEASKEKEKSAQLAKFTAAFQGFVEGIDRKLVNFEASHPAAQGLERNFKDTWGEIVLTYIAGDWIKK